MMTSTTMPAESDSFSRCFARLLRTNRDQTRAPAGRRRCASYQIGSCGRIYRDPSRLIPVHKKFQWNLVFARHAHTNEGTSLKFFFKITYNTHIMRKGATNWTWTLFFLAPLRGMNITNAVPVKAPTISSVPSLQTAVLKTKLYDRMSQDYGCV